MSSSPLLVLLVLTTGSIQEYNHHRDKGEQVSDGCGRLSEEIS